MSRFLASVAAWAAPVLIPAALYAQAAQSSDGSAAPEEAPATSSPPAPAPAKPRPVSSDTAAMLAATMPKYEPPKPVKPPTPEDQQVDLREIDKPKNGIIRLPKYVVHAEKPPIFREQDLYTKEGLTGVAMKRYAGLNLGPFADLNAPVALQMYQEDERLKAMADMSDTAATMARGGDTGESQYILRQSNDTYDRSGDFGGSVPGTSAPHG